MGPQYQATIDSYAASPQAAQPQQVQAPGNQTLGKAMEQSPVHDGFGTRSSMYDNGMDVSSQPSPTAVPPQPQNQPASAGINPSWAQQQGRKKGGRAKLADGGYYTPGLAQLTVGPPREGSIPGSDGGIQQIPQSEIPRAYMPGPANRPPLPPLTPPDQAAGLAAFNKPGPAEGFAAAPLSQFGSMYNQPNSMMMTGDTLARFGNMPSNLLPMPVQIARRNMEQQALAEQDAARQQQEWKAAQGRSTLPAEVLRNLPQNGGPSTPKYRSTATNLPEHYEDYDVSVASQKLPTDQFINTAYNKYFGRDPVEEVTNYWNKALGSGSVTQAQTEAAFANYANQNANFVNEVFQSDVGRAPTPEEAKYWTSQINQGYKNRQTLEEAIMNSEPGTAYLMSQGVTPSGNAVDPYVSSYNATMNNLSGQLGNQALLNYLQNYMAPTPKTTKP